MSALNSQVVSDGRGWLKLVGLGFTVTGCVITPAMQYPGTQVVSRRLAAFPSEAVAWNYDFYGTRTVDNERRLIVKQNIDDSITYRVRRYGGRSFKAASVEGLDHAQAFRGWAVDTLTEIMTERLASSSGPNHANVGDFRFSNSLNSWRSPLDADFVLITLLLDGHNTVGRAVIVAVGGGQMAARRAIACAVHLQSGRIVWCNFAEALSADLLLRWGAQQEVDLLLGEMLSGGQTAASEPPPALGTAARILPAGDVSPARPPAPSPPGPDTPAPVHFVGEPKPSNAPP